MSSPTFAPTLGTTNGSAPSFEQQLAELERVVAQLERGDLTLEESVALFERGMHLSEACKAELASAEGRIQVLLQPSPRGAVRVEELGGAFEEEDDINPDCEQLGTFQEDSE